MSKLNLPKNISYFQIIGVHVDSRNLGVYLELVDPIEKLNYQLNFTDLLFFSVSKTLGEDDGCYQIGEITLVKLSSLHPTLASLGYQFTTSETVHEGSAFHLHVEGDLCAEIVSSQFDLRGPLNVGQQKTTSTLPHAKAL